MNEVPPVLNQEELTDFFRCLGSYVTIVETGTEEEGMILSGIRAVKMGCRNQIIVGSENVENDDKEKTSAWN